MKTGWRPYGDDGASVFLLLRKGQRCKWIRRASGEQVGPVHANVAPAVAWALYGRDAPGELLVQEWRGAVVPVAARVAQT